MTDHGKPDEHDDERPAGDHPTGGDETTEEQLTADNAVEEDTLKALDPDAPSA
ncbi:hypothetical protein [uncultured Microbacterium sp.]|uniref:hypothetical protein n=1 Tax=uncultured Microbacterium sp. TaxID=191216 RepID=UPI0035CAFCE0